MGFNKELEKKGEKTKWKFRTNDHKVNNSKISLCLINFTVEYSPERGQDKCPRYQAAVTPSPLPYSQPLSVSPAIHNWNSADGRFFS